MAMYHDGWGPCIDQQLIRFVVINAYKLPYFIGKHRGNICPFQTISKDMCF